MTFHPYTGIGLCTTIVPVSVPGPLPMIYAPPEGLGSSVQELSVPVELMQLRNVGRSIAKEIGTAKLMRAIIVEITRFSMFNSSECAQKGPPNIRVKTI